MPFELSEKGRPDDKGHPLARKSRRRRCGELAILHTSQKRTLPSHNFLIRLVSFVICSRFALWSYSEVRRTQKRPNRDNGSGRRAHMYKRHPAAIEWSVPSPFPLSLSRPFSVRPMRSSVSRPGFRIVRV